MSKKVRGRDQLHTLLVQATEMKKGDAHSAMMEVNFTIGQLRDILKLFHGVIYHTANSLAKENRKLKAGTEAREF